MNQPMIQLKSEYLIILIQINQKMSKHHLMNLMVIKILRSKNLKRQIHHLAEMSALIFNILFNLSKNLPQKWTLL